MLKEKQMELFTMPPGFRFHPTDEELVIHYLRPKVKGQPLEFEIIREVDLYKCEPWDLPDKSLLKGSETEWYFFSGRGKKYPRGLRTNRSTEGGYWKATGKDRFVHSHSKKVAVKKTMVFYEGRAPRGRRTDWVMYEYRLEDDHLKKALEDAVVLCRIFNKKRPGLLDAAEPRSPFTIQDDDDLPPLTEGGSIMDEPLHIDLMVESATISTELDGFFDFTDADRVLDPKHHLGIQNFVVVNEDSNLGSITANGKSVPTAKYDPGIAFLLNSENLFPGDASKAVVQPEFTDTFADNEEELIEELYESLLHTPPTMGEHVSDCNHDTNNLETMELQPYDRFDAFNGTAGWLQQIVSNGDALEEEMIEELLQLSQQGTEATGFEASPDGSDPRTIEEKYAEIDDFFSDFEAGEAVDPQESQFWHSKSTETWSHVSKSQHFTVEDSTLVETHLQSCPRNLQSENPVGITVGASLTSATSSTPRSFPTGGSSSQPIDSSQTRPLSVFAKLLDSMSVLPASAAEFPPNFKTPMSAMPAHSTMYPAPSLRSLSVTSPISCMTFVNTMNSCSENTFEVDSERAINSMSSRRNRHRIVTGASGSFSFVVLVGALSAMSWFLLLRVAWGFARRLCTLLT
ncbi:hypothetical protein O6H91_03G128100 [Diphasiastrum complanatum]|uniref:Uncharacterized protein n=3 Tax=Diphasiastrum complanatum TaxID=34168 RepID=A0ACC2EBN8_DIPCM|nr:hypothetical protein O6H91_03G128100 [Diphasiastrum complanatum]KAJ7563842.1 hypothetical protein O6H91_03G128100 [Diphasiastrum complanatum]KAJ7563844.1 hypothetical protein O6H91_03G128100 [Diphasiastrum complanatum]